MTTENKETLARELIEEQGVFLDIIKGAVESTVEQEGHIDRATVDSFGTTKELMNETEMSSDEVFRVAMMEPDQRFGFFVSHPGLERMVAKARENHARFMEKAVEFEARLRTITVRAADILWANVDDGIPWIIEDLHLTFGSRDILENVAGALFGGQPDKNKESGTFPITLSYDPEDNKIYRVSLDEHLQ
jgi:hypothetical protein